ncbi:MAG: type IV pilus modification protein PilV [Proteobacteria bacterium]|nr:type IV pilus modification protein PilV [Pseudomonadota bacterium]
MNKTVKKVAGFSMIELLVAVLVMGIGVLGITGLQMISLQNNRAALYRAEAVQLAYDMLDRIRANQAGAVPGLAYDGVVLTGDPPAATDCNANVCTQAQMVIFDQAVWKCSLGGFHGTGTCQGLRAANVLPPANQQPGLPNGDGAIAVNAGTGVITVTVQWTENNNQIRTIVIDSQG